jgi:hypothetical protein
MDEGREPQHQSIEKQENDAKGIVIPENANHGDRLKVKFSETDKIPAHAR